MSLRDELAAMQAPKRCKTGIWLNGMNANERTEWVELIAEAYGSDDHKGAYKPLWILAGRKGLNISDRSFYQHINAECICEP